LRCCMLTRFARNHADGASGLSEQLGVMLEKLQRRPATATRKPKGEYFNLTGADAIVEVVTNPGEMQTPYAFHTGMQQRRAPTLGSTLRSENAFARSSSKASGARSRFSSHH